MSVTLNAICHYCTRFHGNDLALPRKCDAFPNAIPVAILNATQDHTEPFPNDQGLQFNPFPGFAATPSWRTNIRVNHGNVPQ